jgi:hypothetical protein
MKGNDELFEEQAQVNLLWTGDVAQHCLWCLDEFATNPANLLQVTPFVMISFLCSLPSPSFLPSFCPSFFSFLIFLQSSFSFPPPDPSVLSSFLPFSISSPPLTSSR